MADWFEMMMSGGGMEGYKPRSVLDLLISDQLTPDQNKAVQSRGRLGLAKGLLAMSGPSPTPISFGQAFASGIDQMQQARAGAVDEMLKGAQIKNLTDDGEVDEDIEVYMTEDDPDTNFDETTRKTIIKRSQYDPKLHRLELEEVEKRDLKVYPLVDNPETDIDETQQGIFIKPSDYDETKYSADPGYQNEYIKAKKIAEQIHSGDPAKQVEYIKSQVGALTKNDEKLFNQKIILNDQQIALNNINNQYQDQIKNLEIDKLTLHNKGQTLTNEYQTAVNENKSVFDQLDIQSKQLKNLKDQVELETLPDIKEAELINLKTNIEATRQNIDFNDKANIKKLDKMDLEIDGLMLKNDLTKLELNNAPIKDKLQNESLQLDNLKKKIDLEFAPDKAEEELKNLRLSNEKLIQDIDFDNENNFLLLAKNKLDLEEIQYKLDNPDIDWEQIKIESKFRTEFNALPQVKQAIEKNKYYDDVSYLVSTQNANDAKNATATGDIAIMFNFMKMLDPDSVVREGEQVLIKNAKSYPSRVVTMFQNAQAGVIMTKDQREDILNITNGLMEQAVGNYNSVYDQYANIAEKSNLNVDRALNKLEFPKFKKVETNTSVINSNPALN